MVHVQRFLLGALAAFAALVLVASLFGPKPGAPEGQRVLGWEPFWLARIDYWRSADGGHHWEGGLNPWLSGAVLVGVGAFCVRAGIRRDQAVT